MWLQWAGLGVSIASLLLLGIVLPMLRHMYTNDLAHIQAGVDRVEKLLQEHLDFHLRG